MENILTRKLVGNSLHFTRENKPAFYAVTLVVVYVRPSEMNLKNMVRYAQAWRKNIKYVKFYIISSQYAADSSIQI